MHQSQHLACQRCRCLGHHTPETKKCDAFIEDPEVITVKSPQYVLCNYYLSPLKVFETEFASSEHAYQWRFLRHIGEDALAQEVLEASCPADAKAVYPKCHVIFIKLAPYKDVRYERHPSC